MSKKSVIDSGEIQVLKGGGSIAECKDKFQIAKSTLESELNSLPKVTENNYLEVEKTLNRLNNDNKNIDRLRIEMKKKIDTEFDKLIGSDIKNVHSSISKTIADNKKVINNFKTNAKNEKKTGILNLVRNLLLDYDLPYDKEEIINYVYEDSYGNASFKTNKAIDEIILKLNEMRTKVKTLNEQELALYRDLNFDVDELHEYLTKDKEITITCKCDDYEKVVKYLKKCEIPIDIELN